VAAFNEWTVLREELKKLELRLHTMLIIGGRDMGAGAVSVRLHHGGPQGAKPKGEVVAEILASIKERRA